MLTLRQTLRRAGSALAFIAAFLVTQDAPTIQRGLQMDASDSAGSRNSQAIPNGDAAALGALPTDGSLVETVDTLSSKMGVVAAPAVITIATSPGILPEINTMAYLSGNTAPAAVISTNGNTMTGSANFNNAVSSMNNIATDGASNMPMTHPLRAGIMAATTEKAASIDALTAEAIGSQLNDDRLRDVVPPPVSGSCNNCHVVLADRSPPTNPMTSAPGMLPVNDSKDSPVAINDKAQEVAKPVSETGGPVQAVGSPAAEPVGPVRTAGNPVAEPGGPVGAVGNPVAEPAVLVQAVGNPVPKPDEPVRAKGNPTTQLGELDQEVWIPKTERDGPVPTLVNTVPEPGGLALFGLALAALCVSRRKITS